MRQPMCIKEKVEARIEENRKISSKEVSELLPNRTKLWNVTKRKRSGGGRIRSANMRQDRIGDTRVLTLTPSPEKRDVEAAHDVTGISNQAGMHSFTLSKHKTNLFPNGHIEKFLTGNSNPMLGVMTHKMNSTSSEARVPHDTIVSRYINEKIDVDKTAGKFPADGGPLFKRLLSALIDESQDFDHLGDEKTDPSTMQDWEIDFLGSAPDENRLLKELHLIGIYPEMLPGLVEKEDDTEQDNEVPHEIIYPKLATELTLRSRGRPRSKHVKKAVPRAAKNSVTEENKRKSGTKRKRGRKPNNPNISSSRKEPTLEILETESKRVTRMAPKVSKQEMKSASPCHGAEHLVTEDDSIEGLDVVGFHDPPEDLSSMLDLDDVDDYLPQDGVDLPCLDIPMDDISTLNFNFWP